MSNVEHKDRAHALLGASSSHKWLNCTPSAKMEDALVEVTSSYAEEGTTAHEYAELLIQKALNAERPAVLLEGIAKIKASKWYNSEFEAYVQDYVDYALNLMTQAKNVDPNALCLTEKKLCFDWFVPEGFGTGDLTIYANRRAVILDLKFGKGVRVDATDNPQLKLYALGFLQEYYNVLEVDSFTLIIFQPRLEHESVFEISTAELVKWGQEEVIPKSREAMEGTGETRIGEWCRFCKAKHRCNAMIKEFDVLEDIAKKNPNTTDMNVINRVIQTGEHVATFISHVRGIALSMALAGNPPDGFKAVAGVAKRAFKDDEEVAELLEEAGFKEQDIYKRKLIPLTKVEKLVGKPTFAECFEPFVVRKVSSPSLVPVSDKRAALTNKDDFEILSDEEDD
jgi:hypothetical protein